MSRFHPFILWMQHAENTACRKADIVVSMLPKAEAHLRQHGMSAEKFFHIPNGIDPVEWADEAFAPLPAAHAAAIQAARQQGHLLVSYAGAHGIANALDSMLDAAALTRHAPVTWLLVGSGPEKARLVQRVQSENLNRIVMLDAVPKAAIPPLLRSMDVLYIGLQKQPLFRFGISPNKLVDYMMAGRPVICAIDAGNDPVRDANCGMTILPEDPAALANAVQHMCTLSAMERDRMGKSGRVFVEQNHIYPTLAQRFIQAIEGQKGIK